MEGVALLRTADLGAELLREVEDELEFLGQLHELCEGGGGATHSFGMFHL